MPAPGGFSYDVYGDGTVAVAHHGRPVTTLRGERARRFLVEVESGDPQPVTARWTGNHRRGNERTARAHPRNRR
ncbi:hypothetical protein IQ279_12215 [Streptomyces verrucosisporus]|uniref:hypothetical protein n=1 Tax=Streptomyces verrucosisporus TaxID=1695161 RepID=UPI0019CFAC01|nr:hypothetical protein [Streptomyces verrucosisporus]MBN3930389.1 hypothetical protein [Streptomyces verrucosisporus]